MYKNSLINAGLRLRGGRAIFGWRTAAHVGVKATPQRTIPMYARRVEGEMKEKLPRPATAKAGRDVVVMLGGEEEEEEEDA